jgi:death-on-curing protein
MAAAALLHAIVHNHPFHNGNKRTALVAMIAFLDENSLMLTCDEDPLFKLVLQLAQHAIASGPRQELPDREVLAVARWLKANCRWIEMGNRRLSWRRLQQILTAYGCECASPPNVGGRMNVSRIVERRSAGVFRQRVQRVPLRTQVFYGDPGRDVDGSTINKIRHDLELDDDHGIDSAAFYDKAPVPPSEFIRKYRKTLTRLARL